MGVMASRLWDERGTINVGMWLGPWGVASMEWERARLVSRWAWDGMGMRWATAQGDANRLI